MVLPLIASSHFYRVPRSLVDAQWRAASVESRRLTTGAGEVQSSGVNANYKHGEFPSVVRKITEEKSVTQTGQGGRRRYLPANGMNPVWRPAFQIVGFPEKVWVAANQGLARPATRGRIAQMRAAALCGFGN